MMNRLVSWILCLCLLVSVMPTWTPGLAEGEEVVA